MINDILAIIGDKVKGSFVKSDLKNQDLETVSKFLIFMCVVIAAFRSKRTIIGLLINIAVVYALKHAAEKNLETKEDFIDV